DADVVPRGKEAGKRDWWYGLDLAAQRSEGAAAQDPKDFGMAVLAAFRHLAKLAGDDVAFCGQTCQAGFDRGCRQAPPLRRVRCDERSVRARIAAQKRLEGVGAGFEKDLGQADRKTGSHGLAIAAGVLRRDPTGIARDPYGGHAPLLLERAQPL